MSVRVSWKHALEKGNEIHDELFDNGAVNVSVEEAVELAAEDCNVLAVVQEYNAYRQNVLQQFTDIMRNIANQSNSLHVVVVIGRAMLFVVASDGSLIVAFSKPGEFLSFSQWFSDMLMHNWHANLSVSVVSVSTVSYRV